MRAKKLRICLLVVLIITIGIGIYYYITYNQKDFESMGGTLVKKIEKSEKNIAQACGRGWHKITKGCKA